MDFERFENWAHLEVSSVLDLIEREGVENVETSCQHLGRHGVFEIAGRRLTDAIKFLKMTKGQRDRYLEKISDDLERHAFLILVAFEARIGLSLLVHIRESGLTEHSMLSRKTVLTQARNVVRKVRKDDLSVWPFGEGDPFQEGLQGTDDLYDTNG